MKSFIAIFRQTLRSAIRSKVFIVLFALILISVIGLPLTIKGDNTAAGLVQISLTYSLNVVIALISASTLWLGCSLLATEIESYNVHLIVSKPCPRWILWLGKWAAIVVMHTTILVISMLIIYGLTQYRLVAAQRSGLFTAEDIAKLHQETLVGRRKFYPVPVNLAKMVNEEYDRRVRTGRVDPKQDVVTIKKAIQQELIGSIMRNITLKPGESRSWKFENVNIPQKDTPLYLRFRIYTSDISDTDQRQMPIDWGFEVYRQPDGTALPQAGAAPQVWYSEGVRKPFMMPGGSWQELSTIPKGVQTFNATQFPVTSTQITTEDKTATLLFRNLGNAYLPDPKTVDMNNPEAKKAWQELERKFTTVFQVVDGPYLLCKAAGFFNNYLRTMVMAIFQIIFLAGLGSTVGAIFSTPVAVFVAISYIIIGLVVPAAVSAPLQNADGSYNYNNVAERAAHYVAQGVQGLVVTVDDLDCTSQLASGQLVELRDIGSAFTKVLLFRTGVIALLGIAVLTRRELGLVVRKL